MFFSAELQLLVGRLTLVLMSIRLLNEVSIILVDQQIYGFVSH